MYNRNLRRIGQRCETLAKSLFPCVSPVHQASVVPPLTAATALVAVTCPDPEAGPDIPHCMGISVFRLLSIIRVFVCTCTTNNYTMEVAP